MLEMRFLASFLFHPQQTVLKSVGRWRCKRVLNLKKENEHCVKRHVSRGSRMVWARDSKCFIFFLFHFLINGFYSLFSFPFRILSFIRYLFCPFGDDSAFCLMGFPNDCVFLNSLRVLAHACVHKPFSSF